MGLNLKDMVVRERISLDSLNTKVVAIDAYNALYQFLSTIRGSDGMPLADSAGNTTSHISGILYRCTKFMSMGIRPVWVFDGKPPSLKSAEIEKRKLAKEDAVIKYEQALARGDAEKARVYAQQTTRILDKMIDESKEVLDLFGLPHLQAPSEGEATAAHLTITGQAWASASQDYDSVLFGARRLIRNFAVGGRRKVPNRNFYVNVEPEIVHLEKMLKSLEMSRPQLVDVGILVGTDFNPGGFRRIGPKTALKLIKKYGKLEDIPQIQESLDGVPYRDIRKIFLEPDVASTDGVVFENPDYDGLIKYMVEKDFSRSRAEQLMGTLRKSRQRQSQTLDQWF